MGVGEGSLGVGRQDAHDLGRRPGTPGSGYSRARTGRCAACAISRDVELARHPVVIRRLIGARNKLIVLVLALEHDDILELIVLVLEHDESPRTPRRARAPGRRSSVHRCLSRRYA